MGVYEDMANDAGYRYGSDENGQMAQAIEQQQVEKMRESQEEESYIEECIREEQQKENSETNP